MSETVRNTDPDTLGVGVINLPAEVGLRESQEFLDSLSDVPDDAQIEIDASEVEKVHAACILAVASAVKHREETSSKIALTKPSKIFVDAFTDLGLFQHLMKMEFR